MLFEGIALTLATGLLWSLIGIVYSKAAEKPEGFRLFLALGSFCFALACWGANPPAAAPVPEVLTVAAVMIPAGILGQLGFLALRGAMRRGGHGASWGIAQSAMLCPFAAGMLFFGERVSAARLAGMGMLLAALVPLSRSGRGQTRDSGRRIFLFFAFLSFALLGAQQTLTLIPNRLPELGAAALSWRVPLLSLCGLGWFVAAFTRRESGFRVMLLPALCYGALAAAGQWTMFRALDLLSGAGAAGIAYPLAVGGSVALFFLYSEWIRKEKNGLVGAAGILLAVLGMFLLAF